MASDVLKEFLVKIGYQNDDAGLREVNESLAGVAEDLGAIGTTATAMATAVTAGIVALSEQMGKLEFAAQRTRSSVGGILDLQYAFQKVGLSADSALPAIERISQLVNTDFGRQGLLRAWGIDPSEGGAKLLPDILDYLHSHFSTPVGFHIASERFGITYEQYMANTEKMRAADKESADIAKKAGQDREAEGKKAVEFNNQLLHLKETLADKRAMAAFEDFLPTAEKIMTWLEKTVDWFDKLDASTGGLARHVGELTAALVTFVGTLKGVQGIAKIFRGLTGAGEAAEAAEGVGLAGGLAVGGPVAAGGFGIYELYKHKDAVEAWNRKFLEGTPDLETMFKHFEGYSAKPYKDSAGNWTTGYGHMLQPGEAPPKDDESQTRRDIAGAVAEIHRTVKVGLTKGQEVGLEDFILNLGAGRFEKSILPFINRGDFAAAAAKIQEFDKVRNRQGVLVHSNWQANRRDLEARLVAPNVNTVSQKTDIHIATTAGAEATAAAIKKQQDKTNTDMIRNLQGVMQ